MNTAAKSATEDPVGFVNEHREDFGEILNVFGHIWTPNPRIQAEWMAGHVANHNQLEEIVERHDLIPERIARIRLALTKTGLLDPESRRNSALMSALTEAITILLEATEQMSTYSPPQS